MRCSRASPEERTAELEQELVTLQRQLEYQDSKMHKALDEEAAVLFREPRPLKDSFWFDEDDDDPMTHDVEGENFDEDDITSMAHGKLDELREYRHYARIVAWEMPLLSSGGHVLSPDLGLTPAQELKLKKLAGARYNPEKDEIKMSCESFDHQAQNKRYLRDQANKLIEAAKPKFPVEWRMTEERRRELDQIRARSVAKDLKVGEKGKLIDGSAVVQAVLSEPAPERSGAREAVPEMQQQSENAFDEVSPATGPTGLRPCILR
ncbi:unnamed protein product [Parascedosporium putredinis]|uniref:Small ribosomal subunit protein mS35 mitochondrial conserved domain-containing protein n=1 Tax=Parascedosporium putredinis TaxID=1442378 RepID=A0A9P1MB24_9PEZI|nr:unnamed protein product [Parascedosporium putredinis]CAI7995423.1 unnamed protein product [Parascedosporium putredinis]